MARPATIKDEEILRAAARCFSARGISATTAEVAERARISEGTIFHRFKSKAELFRGRHGHQADDFAAEWVRGWRRGSGAVRSSPS